VFKYLSWLLSNDIFHVFFRHGRLREQDQILAIDGQPLDISHQQAIKILQSAGGLVEIVVARGPNPQATVTPGDQEEQVTDSQTQNNAEVTDMVCLLLSYVKQTYKVYIPSTCNAQRRRVKWEKLVTIFIPI
jgi:hypothetical protein